MSTAEYPSEINSGEFGYYSTDSDDALKSEQVEELLQGLSIQNDEDTRIDSILLNKSCPPDVGIYPKTIKFPSTFPNVPLTQKISLSNGGILPEHFKITLTGAKEFQIGMSEVEVQPGENRILELVFDPKTVALFHASLIFEGRASLVATVSGHSIPSPLDYPPENSDVWKFRREIIEREIVFSNRSISTTLTVSLDIDDDKFSVSPDSFSLLPLKSSTATISFTPSNAMSDSSPTLRIECEQSGDFVDMPLKIAPPRSRKLLNFGSVVIGKAAYMELPIDEPYSPPAVNWPFTFQDEVSDESLVVFGFNVNKTGTYSSIVEFENLDVELLATAVLPPYDVKLPHNFPKNPLIFTNLTSETVTFQIQSLTNGCLLSINDATLRPKQSTNIALITKAPLDCDDVVLQVTAAIRGRNVVDTFTIPASTLPSMTHTQSQIKSELHDEDNDDILISDPLDDEEDEDAPIKQSHSINASIALSPIRAMPSPSLSLHTGSTPQSQQRMKSGSSMLDSSPKRRAQEISLQTPPSQSHAYGASRRLSTISSQNYTIPASPTGRTSATVSQSNDEDTDIGSRLESFAGESGSSSSKHSDELLQSRDYVVSTKTSLVSFPRASKQTPRSFQLTIDCDDTFEVNAPDWVQINDEPESGQPMMLVCDFLPSSARLADIEVSPTVGEVLKIPVLAYKGQATFDFDTVVAVEKGRGSFTIRNEGTRAGFIAFATDNELPIDVFMEPIAAVVKPGGSVTFDIYAKSAPDSFAVKVNAFTGDEIMRQIRAYIKPDNFFAEVFKGIQTKDELGMIRGNLPEVSQRPLNILFKNLLSKTPITIAGGINKRQTIAVSPASIELQANQRSRILIANVTNKNVTCTARTSSHGLILSPTSVRLGAFDEAYINVTMHQNGEGIVEIQCGLDTYTVTVNQSSPVYESPRRSQSVVPLVKELKFESTFVGESRSVDLTLRNDTRNKAVVSTHSTTNMFRHAATIAVPPMGEAKLIVEFAPKAARGYRDELVLQCGDDIQKVLLSGKGVVEKRVQLEFPPTLVGSSRKANVKVANKTRSHAIVSTEAPHPFEVAEKCFGVNARSYVLMPVIFKPTRPGKFKGCAIVKSKSGVLIRVELSGEAFE